MRILVCGGRGYADKELLYKELDKIAEDEYISMLIHGAAKGADSLAGQWARDRGVQEVVCPANWDRHGRKAGYLRNKAMRDLGPDLVVAFPGGTGTQMMVELAREARIDVKCI